MGDYAFAEAEIVSLLSMSTRPFPVRRIFCVGQNYRDHAKEMGSNPETEEPFFFMKPPGAILQNGETMPYPPGTNELHHEVELVVALNMGGKDIPPEKVNDMIFGYAVGLDMTKRDVQREAKAKGRPWEMSKAFDFSAPCSSISPEMYTGIITKGKIQLKVNGELRQNSDVSEMIWDVPHIVHYLSKQVEILPGDLIFTGTPAGVGPVVKGDKIEATISGLEPLIIEIG
ncbi:fumarylacetoacetate hydrolase family protein [Beijerinckia indica]|uniref:Fumarylacetoacetate (FAA) hydrolase n=1 Tax=Beijerinckia indica subsp. indica (strain ATCC 9039 / DSM 1715 / NCIMB 8712) TaxID=395963 RepID=B2IJ49_BEII9|nr:fumarylacetoacetate hydrolase family protein [Beijerinckia indica]ACB94812.1 fumarylacetoacetate (FAA) hydrolase [Beijerinckia indica subsp. indica ATCC 9039]